MSADKVYVPRAVLVDTDPTALNAISSGGGIVFRPGNLVIGDGGTDGNWARGYYAADGVPGLVLSAIRSEAERCDRLQGFQIVHSLSGGTGSGLGARVVDAIRQTFPGRTVNTFSVVPRWWSAVTGRGALQAVSETYNATLSAARLIDAAHNTYVADNRTLYDTCAGPAMNIDAPSYDDLNHLVTQTMSGVTTGLRFTGDDLNADMRKCTANLVPYPRMHFFAPVFAPYTYRGQTDGRAHTVTELGQRLFAAVTSRCVNRRRRRPRPPPTRAGDDDDALPVIVMAAAITFRGEGLQRSAADDKRRVAAVVAALPSWLPDNVKTAYYDVPSRGLRTSGTVVANTTAVADAFDAVGGRYAAALAKKSFLRPYTDEGMTVDDFKYALEQIETLTADYRSLEDGDYHRRREL